MRPSECSQSERLNRDRLTAHNHIALLDLMQKASKHGLYIEAPIVPEAVLVQVGLQIVTANVVVNAPNPGLDQKPEPFDGVRVNVPVNVDLLTVIDPLVRIAACSESVVRRIVIREDHSAGQYVFLDQPAQRIGFNISGDEGPDLSLALDHADHGSFLGSTSPRSYAPAAIVRFVHFDLATESANRSTLFIGQHGANLLEHAPRRLIRHARLALNLFRGDAATGLRHQVDGIEPSSERSGRLVEDRASGWVNVMAATVARVRRTAHDAMMLSHRFALFAVDAFRIQTIAKPFKAGCIVWELALEVFQRVRQHFRLAVVVGHLFTYSQVKSYQMAIPTVKG
jgi:hypothetical protein